MKFSFTILSVVAAATVVSANKPAKFHPTVQKPGTNNGNIVPNSYIIQYKSGYNADTVHDALANHNVNFKITNHYKVFNGASIQIHSDHTGPGLAAVPGIKNVYPVVVYPPPKVTTDSIPVDYNSPQLTSAHNLTGVTQVHAQYGYTGKGVKVGVVDTGLDYTHPAFGGCMGPSCRVRWGWDFVGDDYTGTNTGVPDSDPMDNCQGHGTHVAGIIGANALSIKGAHAPRIPFVGVAPEVHFGAYRVFGCSGGAATDVILAAMERAHADGMNLINLSLGEGPHFKDNPIANLADTLIQEGTHVIVAAGNDGLQGISTVAGTGLSDLATSVASFDNTAGFYYTLKFGSKTYPYLASLDWGQSQAIALPKSATLVPILTNTGDLINGCDAADFVAFDVTGKIALLAFDTFTCGASVRVTNAMNAGAVAVLFSSYEAGLDVIAGIPNFPAATVEQAAGAALKALALAIPTTTITWSTTSQLVKIGSGGVPSTFSSWGLDSELRQKPDISAPGGKIYSTFPLALGGYAVMSGTSMATPYVLGAHALYIQAKNKLSRSDVVRDVFKNTARNTHFYNSTSWVPTIKQGAGMINVLAAIQTTTSILPAKIDLLDSDNFVKSGVFTLKNHGNATETYTISHQSSDSVNSYPTGGTFPLLVPVLQKDHAMVHIDKKTVTLKPGYSTKITITFDLPTTGDAAQFPIYSGFITATPATVGNVPVHVPYAGMLGSVAKIPIQDTAAGVPLAEYYPANGNTNFTTNPGELDLSKFVFTIFTHNGMATPDATIQIFDDQNNFVGYVVDKGPGNYGPMFGPWARQYSYYPDTGAPFYNQINFDGTIVSSKSTADQPFMIAPGHYSIVVASQHLFTKGNYPEDYEVFNMQSFNIVYSADTPI